jgi:hypothetical protein
VSWRCAAASCSITFQFEPNATGSRYDPAVRFLRVADRHRAARRRRGDRQLDAGRRAGRPPRLPAHPGRTARPAAGDALRDQPWRHAATYARGAFARGPSRPGQARRRRARRLRGRALRPHRIGRRAPHRVRSPRHDSGARAARFNSCGALPARDRTFAVPPRSRRGLRRLRPRADRGPDTAIGARGRALLRRSVRLLRSRCASWHRRSPQRRPRHARRCHQGDDRASDPSPPAAAARPRAHRARGRADRPRSRGMRRHTRRRRHRLQAAAVDRAAAERFRARQSRRCTRRGAAQLRHRRPRRGRRPGGRHDADHPRAACRDRQAADARPWGGGDRRPRPRDAEHQRDSRDRLARRPPSTGRRVDSAASRARGACTGRQAAALPPSDRRSRPAIRMQRLRLRGAVGRRCFPAREHTAADPPRIGRDDPARRRSDPGRRARRNRARPRHARGIATGRPRRTARDRTGPARDRGGAGRSACTRLHRRGTAQARRQTGRGHPRRRQSRDACGCASRRWPSSR